MSDTPGSGRRGYEIAKRIFDVSVALTSLVVLSPVLLAIAAAIKFDSRGPALYLARRTGRYGRAFHMWKFRTMVPDSEHDGSSTGKNDPRVTRVGWFLRRYKLDELPQLLNVVRGEMSLVGPRPEVEEHTAEYDERERVILNVRPGLTDYSSLRFFYLAETLGEGDPRRAHEVYVAKVRAEKNALRVEYVRRRSFVEDLRIILRTISVMLRDVTGAHGQR